jgi:hypothetical protein
MHRPGTRIANEPLGLPLATMAILAPETLGLARWPL